MCAWTQEEMARGFLKAEEAAPWLCRVVKTMLMMTNNLCVCKWIKQMYDIYDKSSYINTKCLVSTRHCFLMSDASVSMEINDLYRLHGQAYVKGWQV